MKGSVLLGDYYSADVLCETVLFSYLGCKLYKHPLQIRTAKQQLKESFRPYCLKDHTLVTTGTQCGVLIFMCQCESARSIQHSGSLWVQGCLHNMGFHRVD